MSACEGCAEAGHEPEVCANRDLPMCARTCICRHGAAEPDPTPYWSAMEASEAEGQPGEGSGDDDR
jgi:hypothetical protein